MGGRVGDPFLNRSEMWYFPLGGAKSMVGGRQQMSQVRKLQQDGWAQSTSEYVGFLNGWLDSGTTTVIQGQVVDLGVRGGINDGIEVLRRPCRRPKSFMPAAMMEPHWVIR